MKEHLKNFMASIVCYERTPDGVALADMIAYSDALKSAIAELEQRCDKWKRVAVAQERVHQMRYSSDAKTLLVFAEKDAAIAALGEEWTEAGK